MKPDIQTEEDLYRLVTHFYDKLLADSEMQHFFIHLDLNEHFPKLVQFWAFVLLDKAGYQTNVFEQHRHLKMEAKHFEHWLRHFHHSVDELFSGEKANIAKQRADVIAFTFQTKLGLQKS